MFLLLTLYLKTHFDMMSLLDLRPTRYETGEEVCAKIEKLVWLHSKRGKIYSKEYITFKSYLEENEYFPLNRGDETAKSMSENYRQNFSKTITSVNTRNRNDFSRNINDVFINYINRNFMKALAR